MATDLAAYKTPRFIAGLDVGQMHDATALAILDRQMVFVEGEMLPRFDARHLERLPLQTPYPVMVRGVRERLERLRVPCVLVIDATGVGRGVVDLFREGWTDYDHQAERLVTAPGKPAIIALTMTGAEHAKSEHWQEWTVPKLDIVMTFMVALQQRRFRAAEGPDADMLFKESQNFQWKKPKASGDPYLTWREGKQDDLLLAVAIAVWWGTRSAPPAGLPTGSMPQFATATGNVYAAMRQRTAGGRR